MPTIILAIETSCDDTSIGIVIDDAVCANVTFGQAVHAKYGGVIPEEASRQHLQNIVKVYQEALNTANITAQQLTAIAVTQAPGLLGSLVVGVGFAKGLAQALNIPLIGVHHMQAHILSPLIENKNIGFPYLCLTVSGGHTQIVQCNSPHDFIVLGTTIDDAAGEAFDKVAKMLDLPYPGGPLVDKYAADGNDKAFVFAKPQIADLNYSFSGLKTSVLYFLRKQQESNPNFISENLADICASAQKAIVDVLLKKLIAAAKQTGIKIICLAGGVSANSKLRSELQVLASKQNWQVHIPSMQYCTDNGAMIAHTAYYLYQASKFSDYSMSPSARSVL